MPCMDAGLNRNYPIIMNQTTNSLSGKRKGLPLEASIIIPVHNGEAYLRECLDSALAQTTDDFEIICVDDGSTDGSAQLLANMAALYPRIRVITKECGGVSSARNVGMQAARGDYVLFMDSDDLAYPQLVEKTVATARRLDAQMVIFGFERFFANKGVCAPHPRCNDEHLHGRCFDFASFDGVAEDVVTPNVWRILYDRRFLAETGVLFHEDLHAAEDLAFVYELAFRAKRVTLVDEVLYKYRRDGGVTLTRAYRGCVAFRALGYVRDDAEANNLFSGNNLRHYVDLLISTSDYAFRSASSYDEFVELYAEYQKTWARFACDQADLLAERNRPILDATSSMSDNEYLFWLFDARRASLENANVDKRKLRAQLDKSKREADKLKDKVAQIYESRSYRIGNSLVKGPSKIIKKLKGNR